MNDNAHTVGARRRHLNAKFDSELQELKTRVSKMGQVVDAQVAAAVGAFVGRDAAGASRVIAGDDDVNALEREIDERCVRMLALQQPAATDLRFIAAVLKIVTDLERIGDLAVSIAEPVASLDALQLRAEQELIALGDGALTVLRDGLAAFVNRDVGQAESTMTADTPINAWASRLSLELKEAAAHDPKAIQNAIATLLVAKHIERVAEHATNLAEMAIYTERGEDLRHTGPR
jgi:phosphate transport system protein